MPSDQFAVSVVDGVVHIRGEIDSYVAPALDKALQALPGALTLDCSAVTFLDAAGISVLVQHYQRRCEEGESFRLVEVSRPVRRVLEITQLLRLLASCQAGEMTTARWVYTAERPVLDTAG